MKRLLLIVGLGLSCGLMAFQSGPDRIAAWMQGGTKSFFDGYMQLSSLTLDNSTIQEINLSRANNRIRAKYFAYDNPDIYVRFEQWKRNKNLVLLCSGAFTNNSSVPVGLTMDNGKVVNRIVEEDMDGLVIVYATGGVVVSDIDEGDLTIQDNGRPVTLDVRDSRDKTKLLAWGARKEATIFQTQLLVYKDELRITPNGRRENRERRIQVLARDRSRMVHHFIYNIPNNVYLYDIAKDIHNFLNNDGYEVVSMLNLDTGSYNVFEVYNDSGRKLRDPSGTTPVSGATNLLVYYYE